MGRPGRTGSSRELEIFEYQSITLNEEGEHRAQERGIEKSERESKEVKRKAKLGQNLIKLSVGVGAGLAPSLCVVVGMG